MGLKLSSLIHSPGIINNLSINKFASDMNKRGYEVKQLVINEKKLDIIQISSNLNFGVNEANLINRFESGVQSVFDIENRELFKYYNKNKENIDDIILRSFGILKFCKKISFEEALLLISDVITGVKLCILKTKTRKSMNFTNMIFDIFENNIIENISDN